MKLIDTSAWIEFLRGAGNETHKRVSELAANREAAWCDIIYLELCNGGNAHQQAQLQKLVPVVWQFEIDRNVWAIARKLVQHTRSAGFTIPIPDLIIAACARNYDLEIIHNNDKHFSFLAEVPIQ